MEYCVQVQGPQHKEENGMLEQLQGRAVKMIRGLEHPLVRKAERVGVVQSGEEKAPGDLTAAFQYLKEAVVL